MKEIKLKQKAKRDLTIIMQAATVGNIGWLIQGEQYD